MLESLLNKVSALQACNFIKKRLKLRCFPVDISKILETPILKNIYARLLEIPNKKLQPINCHSGKYFFNFFSFETLSLRERCPYSEFFWSVFSRILTEYRGILRISPYSVRMRENTDQKNSEYRHLSRSALHYPSQNDIHESRN